MNHFTGQAKRNRKEWSPSSDRKFDRSEIAPARFRELPLFLRNEERHLPRQSKKKIQVIKLTTILNEVCTICTQTKLQMSGYGPF